jgi:hypothetical protein
MQQQPQQLPMNSQEPQKQAQKKKSVRREITVEEAIQMSLKQFKRALEYLQDH